MAAPMAKTCFVCHSNIKENTIANLIIVQARDNYSKSFASINLNFSQTDFNMSSMVAAILSVTQNVLLNKHFDWFKLSHDIVSC